MATNTGQDASLGALRGRLDDLMVVDRRALGRRLDRLRGTRDPHKRAAATAELTAAIARAEARIARRRGAVPVIRYPADLPVSQRRDDLAAAIRDHQVVIVAGETGSGKTTQLPKICLELGRGVTGMIGHTQPRRLAARTVAERISEELGTDLGGAVGYAVRFTDRVGEDTLVKLMTDGILLTDIDRDRSLGAYDTLIIDEAHERSLNIDFILGYLKQLLPQRPDLKVIVTSATIDPDRFSRHFGDAPIIEVSGRTYPVEHRYRPLDPSLGDDRDRDRDRDRDGDGGGGGSATAPVRDQVQGICDAVDELCREGPGDILVFLSGEREIRDAAEGLKGMKLRDTEILPLYARLSNADQHRVFQPHQGRRIVLATNVAETSLTVPGIRYVIDPGVARISRYSHRLKVQRLPIEAVSQASANQRAGRCGRVAPGICIRLYAEEDLRSRPEFTEPEILRTNLASVILQMTALGLGNVARFPFIEPPDRRAITDGVRLLQELGALELEIDDDAVETDPERDHHQLTPLGRRLARLPLDPRFGRMVLEADRHGCLREVLIIAAALSIEDPRERPGEKKDAADQFHARFADKTSDFLSYLNLWQYVKDQQRALTSNQFRRLCRNEYLNHLRIREWQDVHAQLRQVANELGLKPATAPANPEAVHRALLAGLLSHIGYREGDARDFRGPRNAKFAVFPGSALAKKPPQWVMAAELVETSRLWARTVAKIQPEWAEELAPHLLKHRYGEAHWSASRGSAMVHETVTLYGLPIVTRRLRPLGQIDREYAREIFIRHALVDGDWKSHHRFLQPNRDLVAEAEALQQRFRRNDLFAGDDSLYDLYDARIPSRVTSARHFDAWWKKARRHDPDLLTFTVDMLFTADDVADLDEQDFPPVWEQGSLSLAMSYAFEPGEVADGATVHIPVAVLNQVRNEGFEWQVPGFRDDRVIALIRSLPKPLRRNLVPVPDHARLALGELVPFREPLHEALARELSRLGGDRIVRDSFDLDKVPEHLTMTFLVEDERGEPLGESKDLDALKAHFATEVRAAITATVSAVPDGVEQRGLTGWSFGELPRRVERVAGGQVVVGYPALVDEGDSVAISMFEHESDQYDAMWGGVRRLLQLSVPVSTSGARRRLTNDARLALAANPYESTAALADDCVLAALDGLMIDHGAPVWDAVAFDALQASVRASLETRTNEIAGEVAQIMLAAAEVDRRLHEPALPLLHPAMQDLAAQRDALLTDGFVATAGADRVPHIVRYVRAMLVRLDALPKNPARDRDWMAQVLRVEQAYARALDRFDDGRHAVELERIGWMIEELRVGLFAQQLGTPEPISEKRILKALAAL